MKVGRTIALMVLVATGPTLVTADPASARRKSTIEFRPVLATLGPETSGATPAPVDPDAAQTVASCDADAVAQLPVALTTGLADAKPGECVIFPPRTGGGSADRYYLGPAATAITDGIDGAKAQFVPGQGWTVRLALTRAGSKAWDRLAREQFHRQVAFTSAGRVVSAPTIQPNDEHFRSFGGTAVISGDFRQREAIALAAKARRANGG